MVFKSKAAVFTRLGKVSFLAVACVAGAVWSGVTPVGSAFGEVRSVAAPEAAASFTLAHVERVRIRVWGNADLSGEYALDHQSSLSFPGLGRIAVGSMTPAELERTLSQKLGALTRTDITVSVDVDVFRPFFIMGHVAEAGAIAWRPGLKVIQAVTLARGVARSDAMDAAAGHDRVVAHHQSQARLTLALAQLARYKAEREGVDEVTINTRIATLISRVPEDNRSALSNLVERQNEMLIEQRNAMKAQIVGLQREREASRRELGAAEIQERALQKQLELTRDLLTDIESLWKRKIVSRSRYLDQRTALLTAEVRYAEAASMLERARASVSAIDQQIIMVPQQRRIALNERIEELEHEIAQLELAALRQEDANDVMKLSYLITRETGAGVETIPATIFTEIQPGDVLIVSEPKRGTLTTVPGDLTEMRDGRATDSDHAAADIPVLNGSSSTAHRTVSASASKARGAIQ